MTLDEAVQLADRLRPSEADRAGERLLRPPPRRSVRYLRAARGLGDVLFVGINSDAAVARLRARGAR